MGKEKADVAFELQFFESVHRKIPDDYKVIEILGYLYTESGRVDEGLEMDRKAIKLRPDSATAHYNLACSHALKGEALEAVEALAQSVKLGYNDRKWLLEDPDLKSLHPLPEFWEVVKQISV